MTPHPRVLLVEDDAALRRFVAMALEDMPIELVVCAAVAPALEQLANGRFALILTDLMMPGESGFELLERLQREPRLRGDARVAVLSAGLTTVVREQLADLDIWRQLSKPVSVVTLVACVQDALDGAAAQAPGPPEAAVPAAQTDGDRAHAVRTYFEGNQDLFDAYRSACMEQFPQDLQAGDAAAAAADLPALRRVAHSLKSVLLTLGYPTLSMQSRALEDTAHAGDLASARGRAWPVAAGPRGAATGGAGRLSGKKYHLYRFSAASQPVRAA